MHLIQEVLPGVVDDYGYIFCEKRSQTNVPNQMDIGLAFHQWIAR